jgi:hypothetical protein
MALFGLGPVELKLLIRASRAGAGFDNDTHRASENGGDCPSKRGDMSNTVADQFAATLAAAKVKRIFSMALGAALSLGIADDPLVPLGRRRILRRYSCRNPGRRKKAGVFRTRRIGILATRKRTLHLLR